MYDNLEDFVICGTAILKWGVGGLRNITWSSLMEKKILGNIIVKLTTNTTI